LKIFLVTPLGAPSPHGVLPQPASTTKHRKRDGYVLSQEVADKKPLSLLVST